MEVREMGCVPFYLYLPWRIELNRCEVIPGVSIEKPSKQLSNILAVADSLHPVSQNFTTTHVILVDQQRYTAALVQRLKNEGESVDELTRNAPTNFNPLGASGRDVAKQVLLSLVLLQRIKFTVGGTYSLEGKVIHSQRQFRVSGYVHVPSQEMELWIAAALPLLDSKRINRQELRRIAQKLDRYYRSGIWSVDRLAIALNSLWAALCARQPDQAYLSLMTLLEAILSTEKEGTTHIIAERAAVLLGRDSNQRYQIYKSVKDLYDIRSKLIHGSAFPKKGRINWNSLAIDAKQAIVPISSLQELTKLAISTLRATLRDSQMLGIIQANNSEETITRQLREFFLRLVFD